VMNMYDFMVVGDRRGHSMSQVCAEGLRFFSMMKLSHYLQ
jgi:hypothetical protein